MVVEFLTKMLTNTAGLMVVVGLLVFAEMFIAKKWFLAFTTKIKNAKLRRSANLTLGVLTTFVLTGVEMFFICDFTHGDFSWLVATATSLAVTLVYLMLEKVVGETDMNELGKAICALVSKSTKFDGKLSKSNIVKIGKAFLAKVKKIDDDVAGTAVAKETVVVDEVIARLSAIVADGEVTPEEKAEVEGLVASNPDVAKTSFYEKYKGIIGG